MNTIKWTVVDSTNLHARYGARRVSITNIDLRNPWVGMHQDGVDVQRHKEAASLPDAMRIGAAFLLDVQHEIEQAA